MESFLFLFSLYSLLLGLAVANATSGLADAWLNRKHTQVSLCTLLLVSLVILRCAEQWMSFWNSRQLLTMSVPWLFSCLVMALPLILISKAMFPIREELHATTSTHYINNRVVLLPALMIAPALSLLLNIHFGTLVFDSWRMIFDVCKFYLPLVVPMLLLRTINGRWHVAGLIVLCVSVIVVMLQ